MAHILAVDDDPDLCTLLKTALERDGHAVEIRTSGVTVTESLCRWADCILLDVMMPGEDGFATCRRIRAITQAPILFLTARTDEQSVLTGLGIGADDYLTKPFEIIELLARGESVLRRYHKTEQVLTEGDLVVDTASRTVTKKGETISLTKKEFDLLLLFVRNKNIALYRETIYERIWGGEYMGDSRTVDLHVQRMRKKAGLEEQIQTVYRVGYRYCP